jgi:hypothetical protein
LGEWVLRGISWVGGAYAGSECLEDRPVIRDQLWDVTII